MRLVALTEGAQRFRDSGGLYGSPLMPRWSPRRLGRPPSVQRESAARCIPAPARPRLSAPRHNPAQLSRFLAPTSTADKVATFATKGLYCNVAYFLQHMRCKAGRQSDALVVSS